MLAFSSIKGEIMQSDNDNSPQEEDFLLYKAMQILERIKPTKIEAKPIACSLLTGGYCPLLNSVIGSLKQA